MKVKGIIKKAVIALFPSLVLAGGAYFLFALTQGMEGISNLQPIIYWFCFLGFEVILIFVGQGQSIIFRAHKYLVYECWLTPFFAFIFIFVSSSSVSSNTDQTVGIGIGGFIMLIAALIGGVLLKP